ncbi:MAG: C4-type zinc ribbon domain-containing protein [Candidatus Neomarinimicrobiota bacterium]
MSSIKNLIELQNIDTKLMELEDILGDLPNKVDELILEEKQAIKNIEEGKIRIKEIQLDLNKIELRVKEDNQKIDHLKDQLFQVTTNKQYDATMQEIDHLKEQLDKDETVDIELMEEKDVLEEKIKNLEKNVESVSKDLSDRRKSLEQMLLESAEQKKLLENDRDELIKTIEPEVLKRYDVVRNARRGTAVVPILGASCSGCGAVVPPQKIAEVRSDKASYTCDDCSRFIFMDN